MLIKTIEYTDYDGNKRKETYYFHLNESEVIKWLTTSGDYTLDKMLERLSNEKNGKKIMKIFEDLIKRSYGRKSIDGRRFEKSREIWEDFYQTEAYSKMFTELVTDAKKAAAFVNAIIPSNMSDTIKKAVKDNPSGVPDVMKDYIVDDNSSVATITPIEITPPTTF